MIATISFALFTSCVTQNYTNYYSFNKIINNKKTDVNSAFMVVWPELVSYQN